MSEALDELFLFGEEKMEKAITQLHREFAAVRSNRANPLILDRVLVEYYGVPTPLRQMSQVTVQDGTTLVISPYDKTILKDIEKAIIKSDIGITPNSDGICIRLNFPPMTEERRRETVKEVKKIGEDIAALALKENVRKIVWFTLEDPNSENALRGCENFGREHAGNDLQITVFDKRYDCLELFEQMLEKGDIPDAVFVHQGDFLFAIRSILEKYALTEKVLVATSGANVRKDKNFRGIVYKNDFQKMGQLAADCIRLLLNGEKEQVPLKTVLTSEVSRIS